MNQSFFIGAVGAHQQLKRLTVHGMVWEAVSMGCHSKLAKVVRVCSHSSIKGSIQVFLTCWHP